MPDSGEALDLDELLSQAARIAGLSRRTLQTAVHTGYLGCPQACGAAWHSTDGSGARARDK